jgi:cation diffusion facilitator CzcD-associated flavoprotein CzcO
MYTLGYRFRPWSEPKAIADGASILNYIRDTAQEFKIDGKIRYNHRVRHASWSSAHARWMVKAETGTEKLTVHFTCSFLYLCTGYYDYENGYTPEWSGMDSFKGRIIHPQKWTDDNDYTGKRVVVIGSGATAVTLVPAMAERAAHVTMLQRSPTYVVSRPSEDKIANRLRSLLQFRRLTQSLDGRTCFWDVLLQLSTQTSVVMKRLIAKGVKKELGEEVYQALYAKLQPVGINDLSGPGFRPSFG